MYIGAGWGNAMEFWLVIGAGVAAGWFFLTRPPSSSATRQSPLTQAASEARPVAASALQSTSDAPIARIGTPPSRRVAIDIAAQAPPQAAKISAPTVHRPRELQTLSNAPGGRFVVLDFETTGLSPAQGARVIEVSAREVIDGRTGQEFLTFVDPGVRVPVEVTQITGITTAMLKGAPSSAVVMKELAAFIGSSPIVGHNVGFDRKFLENEAGVYLGGVNVRTLCTMLLARRVFPGRSSYRLGHIASQVGIILPERLHRASADTWATTHLFDRICQDARLRCGTHPALDHDVLDRLQRVRIASAHDWLVALGGSSRTVTTRLN